MKPLPAEVLYGTEFCHDPLDPGEAIWKSFELEHGLQTCALAITAHAVVGTGEGVVPQHVLKVDDINTTMTPQPFAEAHSHVGFNVTNTGKTTITEWAIRFGFIGA